MTSNKEARRAGARSIGAGRGRLTAVIVRADARLRVPRARLNVSAWKTKEWRSGALQANRLVEAGDGALDRGTFLCTNTRGPRLLCPLIERRGLEGSREPGMAKVEDHFGEVGTAPIIVGDTKSIGYYRPILRAGGACAARSPIDLRVSRFSIGPIA